MNIESLKNLILICYLLEKFEVHKIRYIINVFPLLQFIKTELIEINMG